MSSGSTVSTPNLSPEAYAIHQAESNLPFILGITITFHVLALLSVTARTYVRLFLIRVLGWDDYTMVAAMLCAIGGMITIIIEAPLGLGRHQDTISKQDLKTFKHTNFYYTIISAILGISLVKISVALLLMHFVRHKWYKRVLWSIIGFIAIYTPAAWGTIIFFCIPTAAFWDPSIRVLPTTKCYPLTAFTNVALMNTAINIFTDVVLATLPIPIIWKLQINSRTKIALIGVLSLGYVAVAMGVVKTLSQVTLPSEPDQTFHQGIQTWGFVQLNISIIAACIPTLRPLFTYFGDSISSLTRSRTRNKANMHSRYMKQNDSIPGRSRLRGISSNDMELREMGLRSVVVGGRDHAKRVGEERVKTGKIERRVEVSRTEESGGSGRGGLSLGKDSGSEESILPFHGTVNLKSGGFDFNK